VRSRSHVASLASMGADRVASTGSGAPSGPLAAFPAGAWFDIGRKSASGRV
jgi:hypothetical protein